ncbi:efflux RND transporter periplasmic adaptor subunit [Massilia sp. W12]|uniref:efflux RND transporter periplasmic adaptor subunit n=1 Tax=Massilia sp. W12 TaxID=3126507 RepID=UPI0030CCC5CE
MLPYFFTLFSILSLGLAACQAAAGELPRQFEARLEAGKSARLSAQAGGRVQALPVQAGQYVQAGQLLLQLEAIDAQQETRAAQAQAAAARERLLQAQASLTRQQKLQAQGFLSSAALEQAQHAQRAAQAELNALQAQQEASAARQSWRQVRAPFAGVLAAVQVEAGDIVQAGQPLFSMYDPASLRAVAHVPQGLAGHSGWLLELDGKSISPARLQWLPATDPASQTRELRAELPPLPPSQSGALSPGRLLRLQAPLSAGDSGTRWLARNLLAPRAQMLGVYVADAQGKPIWRVLRIGRQRADAVEVLAGLDPHDKPIAPPLR